MGAYPFLLNLKSGAAELFPLRVVWEALCPQSVAGFEGTLVRVSASLKRIHFCRFGVDHLARR
jgi:hypothetical protein